MCGRYFKNIFNVDVCSEYIYNILYLESKDYNLQLQYEEKYLILPDDRILGFNKYNIMSMINLSFDDLSSEINDYDCNISTAPFATLAPSVYKAVEQIPELINDSFFDSLSKLNTIDVFLESLADCIYNCYMENEASNYLAGRILYFQTLIHNDSLDDWFSESNLFLDPLKYHQRIQSICDYDFSFVTDLNLLLKTLSSYAIAGINSYTYDAMRKFVIYRLYQYECPVFIYFRTILQLNNPYRIYQEYETRNNFSKVGHEYNNILSVLNQFDNISKLSKNSLDTFRELVRGEVTFSTPFYRYACCKRKPFDSCFLLGTPSYNDDEFEAFYGKINKIAEYNAGIGVNCDYVKDFDKFTRYLEEFRSPNVTRKTNFVCYINCYSMNVIRCAQLRSVSKTVGIDNGKSINFTTLSVGVNLHTYFMDAVKNNDVVILYSPRILFNFKSEFENATNDIKPVLNLIDLSKLQEGQDYQYIAARELMNVIVKARHTSGYPYILFPDNVYKYWHDQYPRINTSNLCTEIIQPSNEGQWAKCSLGSIVLNKFLKSNEPITQDLLPPAMCKNYLKSMPVIKVTPPSNTNEDVKIYEFDNMMQVSCPNGNKNTILISRLEHFIRTVCSVLDVKHLYEATKRMTFNVDRLNLNSYMTCDEMITGNLYNPSLGIGLQGFYTACVKLGLVYGSLESKVFLMICLRIHKSACDEISRKLFKDRSEMLAGGIRKNNCGFLPKDLNSISMNEYLSGTVDVYKFIDTVLGQMYPYIPRIFDSVLLTERREHSFVTTIMPTRTTAQLNNNSEGLQSLYANVYNDNNVFGLERNYNDVLINQLLEEEAFKKFTRKQLIDLMSNSSLYEILDDYSIESKKYEKYIESFNVDVCDVIDIYSSAQVLIDQAISCNTFFESSRKLSSNIAKSIVYANKCGLLSLYYAHVEFDKAPFAMFMKKSDDVECDEEKKKKGLRLEACGDACAL